MRALILPSVLLATSSPGSAATPARPISWAVTDAINFCTSATSQSRLDIPAHFEFFQYAPPNAAAIFASKGFSTAANVPALVQRFGATTVSGGSGGANYLRVPADDGAVWIVFGNLRSACDAMITGVRDMKALQAVVVPDGKWRAHYNSQANGNAPLSVTIYTQASPLPDKPGRGWSMTVKALRLDLAKPDGVQMDISVRAGNLQVTPPNVSVSQ